MNCFDLEKLGTMIEKPELKLWDLDINRVDTVYNF